MDKKKREVIVVSVIILALSFINIYFYEKKTFSGLAIGDTFKIDFSGIAFIIQWVLIVLLVVVIIFRNFKKEKEEDVTIDYGKIEQERNSQKLGQTDIDLLYDLLKEKNHLNISTLAKIFDVKKEIILEWCKILEDHNLVIINYPAIAEPEVRIK